MALPKAPALVSAGVLNLTDMARGPRESEILGRAASLGLGKGIIVGEGFLKESDAFSRAVGRNFAGQNLTQPNGQGLLRLAAQNPMINLGSGNANPPQSTHNPVLGSLLAATGISGPVQWLQMALDHIRDEQNPRPPRESSAGATASLGARMLFGSSSSDRSNFAIKASGAGDGVYQLTVIPAEKSPVTLGEVGPSEHGPEFKKLTLPPGVIVGHEIGKGFGEPNRDGLLILFATYIRYCLNGSIDAFTDRHASKGPNYIDVVQGDERFTFALSSFYRAYQRVAGIEKLGDTAGHIQDALRKMFTVETEAQKTEKIVQALVAKYPEGSNLISSLSPKALTTLDIIAREAPCRAKKILPLLQIIERSHQGISSRFFEAIQVLKPLGKTLLSG